MQTAFLEAFLQNLQAKNFPKPGSGVLPWKFANLTLFGLDCRKENFVFSQASSRAHVFRRFFRHATAETQERWTTP